MTFGTTTTLDIYHQRPLTVTDPKTYTQAWSTRVTYRRQPGLRLKEYVCTDSNPEAKAATH